MNEKQEIISNLVTIYYSNVITGNEKYLHIVRKAIEDIQNLPEFVEKRFYTRRMTENSNMSGRRRLPKDGGDNRRYLKDRKTNGDRRSFVFGRRKQMNVEGRRINNA